MSIEMQIVLISALAMVGIIGMPLYAFWMLWRKSGKAKHDKQGHQHQHG
ncbi:MAG: hypothetical protein ACQER6_00335 [Pseudomonadota bacterium]